MILSNPFPESSLSASDKLIATYKDNIFLAKYEKIRNDPSSDAVIVSVCIEARNRTTQEVLWKKTIDSIGGDYAEMPYSFFDFYVSALYIEPSESKKDYLVVQTKGNVYYILDPMTGNNILDEYNKPACIDIPSSATVFEIDEMHFIPIQAMPGMGIKISVTNKSSNACALSIWYTPYSIEARNKATGAWIPVASCRLGYDCVTIVKPGASFETFMTRDSLEIILQSDKDLFRQSVKEYNARVSHIKGFTTLSPFTVDYNSTSTVSYSSYRFVFTAFELSDTKMKFTRIRKKYLNLNPQDIVKLLEKADFY